MKRTIVIQILLLFAFCVLIACAANFFSDVHNTAKSIDYIKNLSEIQSSMSDFEKQLLISEWTKNLYKSLPYAITALLAAIANLVAIIIIVIKDFPVFKPLVDKLSAKRTARKEQCAAVKAEQATTAKQQRIEKLQAELDELKKDE